MPKKEELGKIIRGKGLEALRPTAENIFSEKKTAKELNSNIKIDSSISDSKGEEATCLTENTTGEATTNQEQLNDNCLIKEITLTKEQQTYIQEMLGKDAHQILIWDLFISQDGKRGSLFRNNTALTLNVCCTASGLIAQLKPEFEVHWISYDLLRMQIQPFYKFSANTKPLWNNFNIQFQIKPEAIGFFNFHVIIDIKAADLFWIKEGFVFKIEKSTAEQHNNFKLG